MVEQQSSYDDVALQIQRRSFAHEIAAKIEDIGINDDQRRIIMLDMARCFVDHAMALHIWDLLKDEFGDADAIAGG